MPRAFLITHRRYNGAGEEFNGAERDYSPERSVRLVDYTGGQSMSDGASECGSETSSECPEELYNLTKLAEVSLAAAAGTLIHPSNVIYQRPVSPRCAVIGEECGRSAKQQQQQQQPHRNDFGEERGLAERTRFFFERIEPERENAETRALDEKSEILRLSPPLHRHRHHRNEQHLRIPVVRNFSGERRESTASPASATSGISQTKRTTSVSPIGTGKAEDNEDHECPDCGKKYSTSSNLARHRQTHRSLGDKKARRCPHCDKIYVSMPAFSMHVRTHNQGCKCHYCGKCFSRPWLLQGHIRTHTGEKPFKCTICNKAFADKSNLRAHIQTHSNTKPHVCGRCGKAFALKSYLYKHEESSCMRAHHRTSTESNKVEPQTDQKSNANPARGSAISSPTSVIVPPQRDSTTSFSAIIKHTRSSDESSTPPAKRPCVEKPDEEEHAKESDYVSRMVIRTSVISPNPEHLGRFANESAKKSSFDFADPTRSSAFSRPTSMTLNLAIA